MSSRHIHILASLAVSLVVAGCMNIPGLPACSEECSSNEECGNLVIDYHVGEACDDGNQVSGDGCSQDCSSSEECGNMVIDYHVGEACDDGNRVSWDGCSANCSIEGLCGDGIVTEAAGEECDDAGNSKTCNANCKFVSCGDGFVNPVAGEQCDPPSPQICSESCKFPVMPPNWNQRLVTGDRHTCALLDSGSFRCWGYGYYSQLGYSYTGNIGDNESPASAGDVDVGGFVIQIAAGSYHTCALDSGSVRCWGYGLYGQLGYRKSDNVTPASAGNVDVGGSVIQVVAGIYHTCALLDSGAVRCWGYGGDGQLGYGNTSNIGDNEVPAFAGNVVVGGSAIHIAAGWAHTCALLDSGAVRCWGYGRFGQLGYGHRNAIGDNEAPASAGNVDVGGSVTQIATGLFHTCALLDSGAVRCWGYGGDGQLGYGNTSSIGDNEAPSSAGDVNIGGSATYIVAGGHHTCALLEAGSVRCWGYGGDGQLGYGNISSIGDNEVPASAGNVNVGGSVIQIDAGGRHTCALLDSGAVRCWGGGGDGQLGYGNTNQIGDDETPASAGDVNVGGTIGRVRLTSDTP